MSQKPEERLLLDAGVVAHNSNDLEKAEEFYRKALSLNPHNPDGLHLLGYLAYQMGYAAEAVSLIEDAIQIDPTKPLFFNNIATVYKSLGEYGKAIIAYRQSVRMNGKDPDILNDLGATLYQFDNFKVDAKIANEALNFIRKAIKLNPTNAKYHNNLGNLLRDMAPPQFDSAKESYQRSMELDPGLAGPISSLGLIAQIDEKYEQAEDFLARAVQMAPESPEVLNNYAQFLVERRQFQKAIGYLEKAGGLSPDNYIIGQNKAICYMCLRRDVDALNTLHELMELDRTKALSYTNFAITLRKMLKLQDAEAFVLEALKLFPGDIHLRHQLASVYSSKIEFSKAEEVLEEIIEEVGVGNIGVGGAGIYSTLAIIYLETGTIDQVMNMFKLALELELENESARNNYALALIGTGDLEKGWKLYRKRWESLEFTSPVRPFQKPVWEGQSLEGKTIALWGEQGIGDEIRHSSLIHEMMNKGANIIIECDPRLVEIFERSFDGAKVFAREEDGTVPFEDACDYQIPIIDLAGFFRPTVESFLATPRAYLKADPIKVKFWQQRLADMGQRPKIGILWRSMQYTEETFRHYMTVKEMEPVWRIQGVDFVNLMYAECDEERALVADQFGVNIQTWDDLDLRDDQDDLAALISNLDLVISPSTAVGCLASALDVPVFNLLTRKRVPELLGNPEAPGWAPSMRHIIKKYDEPWGPTLDLVATDIKKKFSLP